MYNYFQKGLSLAITQPIKAAKIVELELNYKARQLNQSYYKFIGTNKGYNLMRSDWDTAIILDACRYDMFEEEYGNILPIGKLTKKTAPGSESREFMKRSFSGMKFHDVVYVTGNPYVTLLPSDTFHAVKLDEAWDDIFSEATPERITETARHAHNEYPNKKIIVHYMTPHLPFVAPKTRKVNEAIGQWRGMYWPEETTREEIRNAYRDNVRVALNHVRMLLEDISGRVIVTADHGEMLGERLRPLPVRAYDHFPSLYVPQLVEVPWLEIESSNRRDIRSDPPIEKLSISEDTKQDRLRALGYLD